MNDANYSMILNNLSELMDANDVLHYIAVSSGRVNDDGNNIVTTYHNLSLSQLDTLELIIADDKRMEDEEE